MKFEIDHAQVQYAAEFIKKENSRINLSTIAISNSIWLSVYDVAKYMKENKWGQLIQTMGYTVLGNMEEDDLGIISVLVNPGITKDSDLAEYSLKQIKRKLK